MEHTATLATLVHKQDLKRAEDFAKKLDLLDKYVEILSHPKHAKQVAVILRRYKDEGAAIPPHYLKLIAMRHLNYITWSSVDGQAELRLVNDKQMLAAYAERLFLRRKTNEGLSIIQRNGLQGFIQNSRVKQAMAQGFTYVENKYIQSDGFCKLRRPG